MIDKTKKRKNKSTQVQDHQDETILGVFAECATLPESGARRGQPRSPEENEVAFRDGYTDITCTAHGPRPFSIAIISL